MQQLFEYFKRFSPLSIEGKKAIEAISETVYIQKNKDLQPIGQTCKTVYFINRGIARIYYYKDGIDITDSFALENNVIARIESLFTGKPSRKGIQILEDAEIIAIDANKLFKLYDTFPELERLFRIVFEMSHVETVNRIEGIQFHTAEEDIKHYWKKLPLLSKECR